MAFIVEDGTGLANANSYVDVAFADAYFDERGIEDWAGKDDVKQRHLILATDYADQRWGERMLGYPLLTTQALLIPRASAYDSRTGRPLKGVTTNWKKAVCEYAIQSFTGKLHPQVSETTSKEVKKKKTVVGPITTEVEYQGVNSSDKPLSFPIADRLALSMAGSSQAMVIR